MDRRVRQTNVDGAGARGGLAVHRRLNVKQKRNSANGKSELKRVSNIIQTHLRG
jgi:hypothetical protein